MYIFFYNTVFYLDFVVCMFSSVDIYSPVSPKSKSTNEYEITIGDLHSNTLLFLFFLRKHQIFLISDEDYSFIVKAYIDLESAQ